MIAVDTNILVYTLRSELAENVAASAAMAQLIESGRSIAIPWTCVHETLNVLTNPRVFTVPTPMDLALRSLAEIAELPQTRLLAESATHLEILRTLLSRSRVVGPKIHDARIAAICIGHGVSALWTADRDFSFFPALTTRNPLVN